MRAIVIVIHPPAICNISQLINTQKQLSIEQFISQSAIKRLNIAILPRAAWSNIQSLYVRFGVIPLSKRFEKIFSKEKNRHNHTAWIVLVYP